MRKFLAPFLPDHSFTNKAAVSSKCELITTDQGQLLRELHYETIHSVTMMKSLKILHQIQVEKFDIAVTE